MLEIREDEFSFGVDQPDGNIAFPRYSFSLRLLFQGGLAVRDIFSEDFERVQILDKQLPAHA